jgi:hypothetical protein
MFPTIAKGIEKKNNLYVVFMWSKSIRPMFTNRVCMVIISSALLQKGRFRL